MSKTQMGLLRKTYGKPLTVTGGIPQRSLNKLSIEESMIGIDKPRTITPLRRVMAGVLIEPDQGRSPDCSLS
jgi:hypothetical protein